MLGRPALWPPADKGEYGNTDQAAALIARATQRRLSAPGGAHRRAVSVDTGTAEAAAAAARSTGPSGAGSSRLGPGSGQGPPRPPSQQGPPRRRAKGEGGELASPRSRFSCLLCWNRRPKPERDETRR